MDNNTSRKNRVIIFDTTLRDGEQAAGGMLNPQEKLEIARQLEQLNIDVIEAGFPINSRGEFEAVRLIAKEVRKPIICALSHANPEAIKRAWEAIKEAEHPRIHIFLSTSDIHLSYQLKKTRDEILEIAKDMVALARQYTDDVEFSPMDASRTEANYLYNIIEAVIGAGATTVNIPDTVGYAVPREFGRMIKSIFRSVPNISKAVVSVHCHNDLGLAVSNSLEAIRCGARQVEGTINGIGERAGNASLEEIIMVLKTRKDFFPYITGVNTAQIYKTSRLVSELTGFMVQPNKAIVGENAFRHASGIHQDGVLKKAATYEIMNPRDVGIPASNLVLGKLSGRHAFKERLSELGYSLSEDDIDRAFESFKEISQKKKEVTDKDIESLIAEMKRGVIGTYQLDDVSVFCGNHVVPTATVRILVLNGKVIEETASGAGPVDAAFQAVCHIVGVPHRLIEFSVKSVTEGIDAIGEVLVRIESEGVTYTGRGASTDIVVASVKAYLNALNRVVLVKKI